MGKLFKPKRYNFNVADVRFEFDKHLRKCLSIGAFGLDDGYCTLYITDEKYIDDYNFYTHEFSELTIVGLIRKYTKKWRKLVRFKGFSATDPAHLISPFGYPNKCTMFPDPEFRKRYKQLMYRLKPEEKIMRDLP